MKTENRFTAFSASSNNSFMTVLLVVASLEQTLKQDLATADAFTRKPRGLRGGCTWWERQETSASTGELGSCGRLALPTFHVIVSFTQSEEYSLTHTTPQGLDRRVFRLTCLLPRPNSLPCQRGAYRHGILCHVWLAFPLPISKRFWEQDPCHLLYSSQRDISGCVYESWILYEVHNLISLIS